MFFVYVGRRYTSSAAGQAIKNVVCEKCGCGYGYAAVRRGVGQASAPYGIGCDSARASSQERAREKLRKQLARAIDPVPCPDCGWVQAPMVAEMRRRTHRWLLWLGWIVAGLTVASIGCALLGATDAFSHGVEPAQSIPILVMAAVGTLIAAAAILGQRMLGSLINPNRNYPDRPSPIPGAPQAFKPGKATGPAVHTSVGPVPAIPLPPLAVEAPSAPANPGSSASLSYERKPPEVAPGGWVTVQLLNVRYPQNCCACLAETHSTHRFGCHRSGEGWIKMPLPLCDCCRKQFEFHRGLAVGICAVVGALVGLLLGEQMPNHPTEAVLVVAGIIALIGGLIGAFAATAFGTPVAFSRFSSSLNTVRIRFRNRAYLSLFMDRGRLV